MAITALFTPDGTDFQIEPHTLILAPESQQLPIKIKLLPKGKDRSFDFNLTLHCDSSVICTSKAHVAVVQSGKGCKFALFVLVRCVAHIPPSTMCSMLPSNQKFSTWKSPCHIQPSIYCADSNDFLAFMFLFLCFLYSMQSLVLYTPPAFTWTRCHTQSFVWV